MSATKTARNAQIVERFNAGEDQKSLALAFGVSNVRIHEILKRSTSRTRLMENEKPKPSLPEMGALWAEGLTIAAIADRVGTTPARVALAIQKNRDVFPHRRGKRGEALVDREEAPAIINDLTRELHARGWTIQSACERAGIDKVVFANWRAGRHIPKLYTLDLVLQATGLQLALVDRRAA